MARFSFWCFQSQLRTFCTGFVFPRISHAPSSSERLPSRWDSFETLRHWQAEAAARAKILARVHLTRVTVYKLWQVSGVGRRSLCNPLNSMRLAVIFVGDGRQRFDDRQKPPFANTFPSEGIALK